MALLQININDKLKKAIYDKAETYDVPATSLVKIVLVKTFLQNKADKFVETGNVFNADRDNKGVGIKIDDLINLL